MEIYAKQHIEVISQHENIKTKNTKNFSLHWKVENQSKANVCYQTKSAAAKVRGVRSKRPFPEESANDMGLTAKRLKTKNNHIIVEAMDNGSA